MFESFSVNKAFRVDVGGIDEEQVISISEVEEEETNGGEAHH